MIILVWCVKDGVREYLNSMYNCCCFTLLGLYNEVSVCIELGKWSPGRFQTLGFEPRTVGLGTL